MKKAITVGISIGDINGIGPEVVLKSVTGHPFPSGVRLALIGPARAFHDWAGRLGLSLASVPVVDAGSIDCAGTAPLVLCETQPGETPAVAPGKVSCDAGRIAGRSIEVAVALALNRRIDALVTAPISKQALQAGGYAYPGHTEMLAALSGAPHPVMMLLAGKVRIALATTHVALRRVPACLSLSGLLQTIRVIMLELQQRFAIAEPKLAVCGLNPHAGEGGAFGDEEQVLIKPAIQQARADGLAVEGPFPADALFSRLLQRTVFDACLAMYHDQGLVAAKILAHGRGVNYTCGLPFIRTSPDHGTAFDLAGKNAADPTSMMEAIRVAIEVAGNVDRE